MRVLVIAQYYQQKITLSTATCLMAAQQLKLPVDILLMNPETSSMIQQLQKNYNASKILVAENKSFESNKIENITHFLTGLAKGYSHIIAASSSFTEDILPRVAAILDVVMLSNVVEIIDKNTYKRILYAGQVVATISSIDPIQIISINHSCFQLNNLHPCNEIAVIEYLKLPDKDISPSNTQLVGKNYRSTDVADLESSDIVICGGKGMRDKDSFNALLLPLAQKMNAAIAGTRAAVDREFIGYEYQVGQSGKSIAPKIYIACAVSGAVQHISGMRYSKTIFAINNNPNAPIFEYADYGLVADVHQVLPKLLELIN